MRFDDMFMAHYGAACQDIKRKDELEAALGRYNDLFMEPKLVLVDRSDLKRLLGCMDVLDESVFPPSDARIRDAWNEERNHLIQELRELLRRTVD